jgi:hypothetical protein
MPAPAGPPQAAGSNAAFSFLVLASKSLENSGWRFECHRAEGQVDRTAVAAQD